MYTIHRLKADSAARWVPQLVELLRDAVDAGASVGFLAPLSDADACQYWTEVFSEVYSHLLSGPLGMTSKPCDERYLKGLRKLT